MTAMDEKMFSHYMDSLDEIYLLRKAAALEAQELEAHMKFAKFPRSRRAIAQQQVDRLRQAAMGDTEKAYKEESKKAYAALCLLSEEVRTLTRRQWEARNDC